MTNEVASNGAVQPAVVEPVAINLQGFSAPDGPQALYQRREKIFTRSIAGRFQRLRALTGWPLLIGYFATPWLQWDGRQAVLFDLPARQFHMLGITFWPQDLWMLGWLLMLAAFALFAVTTVVGRLWCGYTCPQTVWTAIFMWAEQVAEGPRHLRIRLDAAPWSITKLRKRTLKYSMWAVIAVATGCTFVGYFVPIRELVAAAAGLQLVGWPLFWTAFFSLATLINAGWLREQVCLYMCPYARFQGAMIDADTLTVAYDAQRGEPRGKSKQPGQARVESAAGEPDIDAAAAGADCIDCQMCVQVCPTGIDIRDGLQYQCIGCAHCIDACDAVMDKIGRPRGLVRYASTASLAGAPLHWLRPRSVGYALFCVVLCASFVLALVQRAPFTVSLLRDRTQLFVAEPDGAARNEFRLKLANKLQSSAHYTTRLLGPEPLRTVGGEQVVVAPGTTTDVPFAIVIAADQVAKFAGPAGRPALVEVCDSTSGQCVEETTRLFAGSGARAGAAAAAKQETKNFDGGPN